MVLNVGFWEEFIRNQLLRQVTMFVENVENRILPTFDDIENEAEKVENDELDKLCSSCASSDTDPADLAERAHDAGLDYFMIVSGIKQSLLNISAAILYHLFEQQLLFFLRREILDPSERTDLNLIKVCIFKKRCLQHSIDIEIFLSWQKIDELRLVANAVKHGVGSSAIELHKKRPDLFTNPISKMHLPKLNTDYYDLYLPLAGEDLYLSIEDLKNYADAIPTFWDEMISAMHDHN